MGGPHAFLQGGQLQDSLLGLGQHRRVLGEAASSSASRAWTCSCSASTSSRRSPQRGLVGDLAVERSRSVARSSASSRIFASRRSAWMLAARRATSACCRAA
jgi:hypothetical protein